MILANAAAAVSVCVLSDFRIGWCSWTNDNTFLKCCHHTFFDSMLLVSLRITILVYNNA